MHGLESIQSKEQVAHLVVRFCACVEKPTFSFYKKVSEWEGLSLQTTLHLLHFLHTQPEMENVVDGSYWLEMEFGKL